MRMKKIKTNIEKMIKGYAKGKNKTQMAGEILALTALMVMFTTPAFAVAGTDSMDALISYICKWAVKIGLVVALLGGFQIGMSIKNDDSDAKVRGLKTLAAGFMVAGIAETPSLFGL